MGEVFCLGGVDQITTRLLSDNNPVGNSSLITNTVDLSSKY